MDHDEPAIETPPLKRLRVRPRHIEGGPAGGEVFLIGHEGVNEAGEPTILYTNVDLDALGQ